MVLIKDLLPAAIPHPIPKLANNPINNPGTLLRQRAITGKAHNLARPGLPALNASHKGHGHDRGHQLAPNREPELPVPEVAGLEEGPVYERGAYFHPLCVLPVEVGLQEGQQLGQVFVQRQGLPAEGRRQPHRHVGLLLMLLFAFFLLH